MRVYDEEKVRTLFARLLADESSFEAIARAIAGTGALLDAHVRLTDEDHAPYFLRFGQLAYERANARRIAEACARTPAVAARPEVIVGAETSARYLVEALAGALGAKSVLATVDADRRPTREAKGTFPQASRALVVADVLTTGSTIRPVVELARAHCADVRVLAFAAVGRHDTDELSRRVDAEVCALLRGTWQIESVRSCALCRESRPLIPVLELY